MSQAAGPLVSRRRLGAELRRLREAAGLQLADVAAELECSTSKVSRLETGKGIPKVRDVRDMLSLYGVRPGQRFDRLVTWAREGQQQGWWAEFSDLFQNDPTLPDNFDQYVALEAQAHAIYAYESTLIHGLLQTEDYARATIRTFLEESDETEVDRLVELRLKRQRALGAGSQLLLDVVLSEPALRRRVGGAAVHARQIERLHVLSSGRNVQLRVLPLASGEHRAMAGPYSVLTFSGAEDQSIVYLEFQLGTVYVDDRHQVRRYLGIHRSIAAQALGVDESRQFITNLLREVEP